MSWFRIKEEHRSILVTSIVINFVFLVIFFGITAYILKSYGLDIVDYLLKHYVANNIGVIKDFLRGVITPQ